MANRKTGPQPATSNEVAATETVIQERPASIDNGNEARGEVNARENQTRTQPEPVTPLTDNVAAILANRDGRKSPPRMKRRNAEHGEAEKAFQLASAAKQKMAEAADLYLKGLGQTEEAKQAADDAALALYQLRVHNRISADQVTDILGSTWGFKKKGAGNGNIRLKAGDKEASATPWGHGEAVRKRVVKAVQAHAFVNDAADASEFFKPLPKNEVKAVLDRIGAEENGISIWRAYDAFGELAKAVKEDQVRVARALDPKHIASLIDQLAKAPEVTKQAFASNPDLVKAYDELMEVYDAIDIEAEALRLQAA